MTERAVVEVREEEEGGRQTQTDFIIRPMLLCYSYGTDNK